ncbi:LysM repeat protein [Sphingomonas naasensis]|uniref:LysM peptidoglycan-binding domain-containing protein n=1 Tax=Sphingomonas naasensis TaxID=1344951 RepID=A0A4S1WD83_9SPHN|nr:phage tail tip lysozyme [Sphingomonas naasensis]NIJ22169.1 LysM repeat protein [Sphingomonas naasensis]TGX40809.1 LysM peptidoglycan-binding domain-containing protein [Sphingomonas naasensis]
MTGVSSVQQSQTSTSAGGGGDRGYFVKTGDTMSAIAREKGVSLSALIKANPQIVHPDLIRPGQHLNIPAGGSAGEAPGEYTIKPGDTLSAIAAQFGTTWQALAQANNISNPNLIFPNRTLTIPNGTGGTGGTGGVGGGGPVGGAAGSGSSDVAAIAEKYLGQNASSLKGNRNDNLPMNAGVPSNICCANFVSAVLTEAGKLPANLHTDSVAQLNTTLRARGWTPVPASEAKPGDVVIIQGGGVSHTEIVSGPGQMIGSNNVNADGTQRISHNNLSWALSHGAVILRAPGGSGGGETQGTQTGGVVPTGQGGQQARIDQAISYFQSQGWSRAQAIGIVANLDAESNMDAGIRQHGGGPGYGLAQWEGPRQRDFAAWAGHDIHGSSFAEQLRFVQYELTHSEAGAGRALRGATDARSAAEIVTRLYERPADTAGEAVRRGNHAAEMAR